MGITGTQRDAQRGRAPIYRRLPHGPHGMEREDVARHQRARIYGGMVQAVAQHGYEATTVAHVIALAGVSRRAFYELFPNKEECFLATYDILIARSRKLIVDAWSSERGWSNRLHASCKAFLDHIAEEPDSARLVLIDSLAIGPKARERLHLAGSAYERLVANAFRTCPDAAPMPAIGPRAIVGGVRHVVFNRMRERRLAELHSLPDELLDWVEAYRSQIAPRLNAMALNKPPDITPAPAAFLAGDDKRSRVLGSVVHLTLDEGYAELTDPQIAQFAGISTEAFHKQFASKEACFLAVLEEFASEALEAVKCAIAPAATWAQAVTIAVNAFIDHMVSHPALLRLAFVDLFELGPGMIGRMTDSIDRFSKLLAQEAPEPRRAPEVASEAITGAVWDIISAYCCAERMRYLPCLADHLSFVALAPYIGAKEAIEVIEQARSDRRRLQPVPDAARPVLPSGALERVPPVSPVLGLSYGPLLETSPNGANGNGSANGAAADARANGANGNGSANGAAADARANGTNGNGSANGKASVSPNGAKAGAASNGAKAAAGANGVKSGAGSNGANKARTGAGAAR